MTGSGLGGNCAVSDFALFPAHIGVAMNGAVGGRPAVTGKGHASRGERMAITNASDREFVAYLRLLLDHERQCALEVCPVCSTLTNICEFTEGLLFSVNFYESAQHSDEHRVSSRGAG
jgi:hypothetical protein